jgi:hypothetical protein
MAKITVRGWIVGSTTVYGYVTDNSAGYYWTGTALEAYNAAHQSSYKTALTEIGSTGDYQGTIPGTLSAGDYTRTVRDGNVNFGADTFVGANELNWSGTAEVYQTGDAFARIGANGAGLTTLAQDSTVAKSATALSNATWTDARALKLDNLDAAISTRATVAALLAGVVEGTITVKRLFRIILAWMGGKAIGGGTATIPFRDQANTIDRVTLTTDSNGNRSAVTFDFSDD